MAYDPQPRKMGKINIIIDDEKTLPKESSEIQFMTEPSIEEEKTIDKVKSQISSRKKI